MVIYTIQIGMPIFGRDENGEQNWDIPSHAFTIGVKSRALAEQIAKEYEVKPYNITKVHMLESANGYEALEAR